jgi:hypothetical protein
MEITQQLNIGILNYLTHEGDYMYRKRPDVPIFAGWNSVADPYRQCGCHPDIVDRLWDQIGAVLPADCRGLVYCNPALVHSKSGVIFGIGLGTWYGLRLPDSLGSEAIMAGAKTCAQFGTGYMDIRRTLGDGWVFGAWLPDELIWCKKSYETFDNP